MEDRIKLKIAKVESIKQVEAIYTQTMNSKVYICELIKSIYDDVNISNPTFAHENILLKDIRSALNDIDEILLSATITLNSLFTDMKEIREMIETGDVRLETLK